MKRKAFAKINLILDVLDKRNDGYHNINFLMTTIDLYDEVEVKLTDTEDEIKTYNENGVLKKLSTQDNIAYKALKLMKKEFNIKNNYQINIKKNIPISAGMAGGSSNAAAVLHLINKLENLNLTNEELASIGITLGSDVYFCIYSKLSIVKGKGEQLKLIDSEIPNSHILVVNPMIGLLTKTVYEEYKYQEKKKEPIEKIITKDNYKDFYRSLRNDLEHVAKQIEPIINEIENFILNLNIKTTKIIVSGSGPTILVFAPKNNLQQIKTELKQNSKYKEYYINIHKVKNK